MGVINAETFTLAKKAEDKVNITDSHICNDIIEIENTDSADTKRIKYELATKQVNKIKRIDPNAKIIDASDIDWSEYTVVIDDVKYKLTDTKTLLELIFKCIQSGESWNNSTYRIEKSE